MNILITGGAGFIGHHLTRKLLNQNFKVTVYDNLSTGSYSNISEFLENPNFLFINGDILNIKKLESSIKKVDYIVHLAAAVGVFNILQNPIKNLKINLEGTENLYKILTKYNIPTLVASTSEIYGKNYKNGLRENDDRVLGKTSILRWTYSIAKSLDESLGFAYSEKYDLDLRFVRLFNTVGERQSAEYGMVLPRFIQKALNNLDIEVYGTGRQKRSFVYVDDVTQAILKIIKSKKTRNLALNIGNPSEITIINLAKKVINITKSNSKVVYLKYSEVYGENFEDMLRRKPNIDLATKVLDWNPKITIDQIIQKIVQNYKT